MRMNTNPAPPPCPDAPTDDNGGAFALFADRHELPPNRGGLYTGFDWRKRRAIRNPTAYTAALDELRHGRDVRLYVTGLTPALTEFVRVAVRLRLDWSTIGRRTGGLILLHYNRDERTYFEQRIL